MPNLLPHPNTFTDLVLLKSKAKGMKSAFLSGQRELKVNAECFTKRNHLVNTGLKGL